ncbi:hypothetical protein FHX49_001060 [Microbacterium endophyticum]|uniref:Right handed beta helix domain-containing protein n=1 Tax=Microbacterium endophyticum TaxID=1526412 RepID=A0A7W4V2F1_9MICO|nr:right-handed parallel beta-helix repeat-containing protein [Microbacterium endophyticum]MBB2975494.1 hypothetical protein [Microbacterium endophyticum]NIK35487.1 hypothetical protein [Microbacterium endophyticum]
MTHESAPEQQNPPAGVPVLPSGVLTKEERGDTGFARRGLARLIVLGSLFLLVAGVVIAGRALSDGGLLPWVAATPAASSVVSDRPSPIPSVSADSGAADAQSVITPDAAALVQADDTRLAAVSRLSPDDPRAVDDFATTVLAARAEPYTLSDLISLGAVRQDEASVYTETRDIMVRPGATLTIEAPGATLRVQSSSEGSVNLVSWGGDLVLRGSEKSPLTIIGWDETTEAADNDTTDGRAYVRVRNGTLTAENVTFDHLGYWSGRTGGIAVTATEPGLAHATLTNTQHLSLATGLFLSTVADATVTSATVDSSIRNGITVTGASQDVTLDSITVTEAGRDAIAITRSSSTVAVVDATLTDAAQWGLRIDGSALASGPNSAGYGTERASGFTVTGTTIVGAGSGGIEANSTDDLTLDDSVVTAEGRALLLTGPAETNSVTNSRFVSTSSEGVALTGSITAATLSGNEISGVAVGALLVDAHATLSDNSITADLGHAIELSGDARADVSDNTFSGTGQGAVAVLDTAQAAETGNDASEWRFQLDAITWLNAHPMAWLWGLVLVIPIVGLPLIARRRTKHNELRQLLQDAMIRYGADQIARHGKQPEPTPEPEPVPEPTPAPSPTPPDVAVPRRNYVPKRTVTGVVSTAAVNTAAMGTAAVNTAAMGTAALTRSPRPAVALDAQATASEHERPRSLAELRNRELGGREFANMQQFAIAAVLEAGYPIGTVASLFRVPAWRLQEWITQGASEPDAPARPMPRGRR